jgi:multicomponent Na+:H+ antiporter subunit C
LEHAHGHDVHAIEASSYVNPLPHVLMLTAIVVMVATLGVALAIAIKIYRRYGTLEEDEIIEAMK